MDEQRFLINGKVYEPHDPGLQEALARVYGTPARPRCLCTEGGVEMYVSKFHEFVIKRMPESGNGHALTCPSNDLQASESGIGQLLGEAIIERGSGDVELRLGFPLTRRLGRAASVRDAPSTSDVTVARKQLSLRGLLHFLWERAGFNRWYPGMHGKRSYAVLRKFLLQACDGVETKGLQLSERVFVPEPFSVERANEISRRRKEALSALLAPDTNTQFGMMIVIGELKEFRPTTSAYLIVMKHLPDCPFVLEPRAGERVRNTFERELLAWNSGQVRLVAACLTHARDEHCYEIDSLTLMMIGAQWIPLEHVHEKDVADKLIGEARAFIKPLRYETKHAGQFPNFELLDVGLRPLPLDILSSFLTRVERAAKVKAIEARTPKGWMWDTAEGAVIPDLPGKRGGAKDVLPAAVGIA